MNLEKIMNDLEKKHPGEVEYLQAVREVLESIGLPNARDCTGSYLVFCY